jgi:hypothetical protein
MVLSLSKSEGVAVAAQQSLLLWMECLEKGVHDGH